MTGDLYSILGVPPNASQEEIRDAYLRVTRVVHPDRFDPAKQPLEWKQANSMLRQANAAYSVLRNPAERKKYDATRGPAQPGTAQASGTSGSRSRSQPRTDSAGAEPGASKAAAGQSLFSGLPKQVQRRLVERVQNLLDEQAVLRTDSPVRKYIGVALCVAWFGMLFLISGEARWDEDLVSGLAIATAVGALFGGWSALGLWDWYGSPLKCHLVVTPLYFVHTRLSEVRWWPLWSLQDFKVTHQHRNGSYSNTEIRMTFPSGTETFIVSPKESVEAWIKTLHQFDVTMRNAAQHSQWDYFLNKDEFRGVASSGLGKRPPGRPALALGLSLLAGAGLFMIAYTANADNPSMRGIPPRPLVPPETSLPLPTIATEPVPTFDEPEQPLPVNGQVSRFNSQEPIAPLEIRTRGTGAHYYVKLVDWASDAPVLTIFIRGGQTVETDVPLGSYRIRYATGSTWYGEDYLFGPETAYTRADSRFDFKVEGDQVSGYTVELFLQQDGNLPTTQIRPDQW